MEWNGKLEMEWKWNVCHGKSNGMSVGYGMAMKVVGPRRYEETHIGYLSYTGRRNRQWSQWPQNRMSQMVWEWSLGGKGIGLGEVLIGLVVARQ